MLSKKAIEVRDLIKGLFPFFTILEEYFINFKNQKLFFDFFIKELNILLEIQGAQHFKYVGHFHGNKEGFLSSKRRDNLKKEYCEKESIALVIINGDEEIDKKKILDKLLKSLEKS